MRCGELDYALTRIRARAGLRMDAGDWAHIHRLRGFDDTLAALRAGHACKWIADVDVSSDVAALETSLRGAWRQQIHQLCAWLPEPWQPSVCWCAGLVDLDAGAAGASDPVQSWCAGLRARLPTRQRADLAGVETLAGMLQQHRQRFCALPPGSGWPERAALESALLLLLRRKALEPVAALVWIALMALEWERLRGELLRRAALVVETRA